MFVALKFLAQNEYQQLIGQRRCLGLSQQSVSRCLTEVCEDKVFILAIHPLSVNQPSPVPEMLSLFLLHLAFI